MKKSLFILLIFIIFQNIIQAQSCLPEGITFTLQSEIDNFPLMYPGCTEIQGNVYIGEFGPSSNITNLHGLSSIKRIDGYLNVHYISNLHNLEGLENLTYIGGYLTFIWNNHLTDIQALSNLDTIMGYLDIRYSFFTDFTGFASLKYVGGDIKIVQNSAMLDYSGFDSLKVVGGSLDVADNENVTGISGFNSVDSVYGRLYLRYPDVTTISGFNNVKYVGGTLYIEENDALTAITGLQSLKTVGNFALKNNFLLNDLSGLSALDTINGYLMFYQAPLLSASTDFAGLVYIGGRLEISYCNSFTDLSAFHNLDHIGEQVRIYANERLKSLDGLENITELDSDLVIHFNDSLISLNGLRNLDASGLKSLQIYYNPQLSVCNVPPVCDYLQSPKAPVIIYKNAEGCNKPPEIAAACGFVMPCLPFGNYYLYSQNDIDDFPTDYPDCNQLDGTVEIEGNNIMDLGPLGVIGAVNGSLSITYCPYLYVLYGLHHVTHISGDFLIKENGSLSSLSGLDMLDSIGGLFNLTDNAFGDLNGIENLHYIGGSLFILSNDYLDDLSVFEDMDTIGGSLFIQSENMLTDLTPFHNLKSIHGQLVIEYNDLLSSLDGLENIDSDSITNLVIDSNPKLSDCAVQSVCQYIADPAGSVQIIWNATGCNSVAEVDSICFPVSVNDYDIENEIVIYPNPASDYLIIKSNNFNKIFRIRMMNVTGQVVLDKFLEEKLLNISALPSGLYFIEIQNYTNIYKQKVLVVR